MANCICVSYGGKGYTLHGACPVHGPQPAPAEDAERSKLAKSLERELFHQKLVSYKDYSSNAVLRAIERVLEQEGK